MIFHIFDKGFTNITFPSYNFTTTNDSNTSLLLQVLLLDYRLCFSKYSRIFSSNILDNFLVHINKTNVTVDLAQLNIFWFSFEILKISLM